jgi:hypothetical protein
VTHLPPNEREKANVAKLENVMPTSAYAELIPGDKKCPAHSYLHTI